MKTKMINSLTVLVSSGMLLVSACKKEETITPAPTNPANNTSSLGSFFTTNESDAKQTFTIDANTAQSITGAKGTTIYFQPNIFKTASGAIATGNISIQLIEVQSKADMILLNKTTVSNGKLLVSGGEFSVRAFQGNNQLTLVNGSNGMYVQVPSNNPNDNNMILFAGQTTNGGGVNWALTGLNGPNTNVIPDTLGANGGYSFWLGNDSLTTDDSLGWTNIDKFMNGTNNTHITVNIPSGHNGSWTNGNTKVYVFFNNIYTVAPLEWSTSNNNFGTHTYTTGLPIGEQIKIVAISEINGKYYSSITPATITAGMTKNITFTETTLTALKNDLNNL